jgi:hypothetical protein
MVETSAPDPYLCVFGPPRSGSVIFNYLYGSVSFHQQVKNNFFKNLPLTLLYDSLMTCLEN